MTQPQIQAWLDQADQHIAQVIRRHGVFIQYVGGPSPVGPQSFAYTVGLFGLGHRELVVVGVSMDTASELLNEVSDRVRGGDNLIPGQLLTFKQWGHRVTVEELPNPGEILFSANRHYERPPEVSVPAYQLTYDDKLGAFPWDDGYSDDPDVQPRPGTWRA